MSEYTLSIYQQTVVRFVTDGKGNLVISAVAGSGKTFIIVYIAGLLPPQALSIFIAFNKHIIAELKKRLPKHFEARTCHSLGWGPCAANAPNRRLILDSDDPKCYRDKYGDIIHVIIERDFKQLDWELKKNYTSTLKKLINFSRNTLNENTLESLRQMASDYNIEVKEPQLYTYVTGILEEGIRIYKQTGAIDYTDMIWLCIVLNMDLKKFDYILVDEFQDLNRLQQELIFRSCHSKTRALVVGDPMQSMYGFTGAMIGSMDSFRIKANATQLPLSICYRCPKSHVRIARFIDGNRTEASPDAEEGLVEFILNDDIYKTVQTRDLILSRTTAPLLKICVKLIGQRKAAKVLGRNIGRDLVTVIENAMRPTELTLCMWEDFPTHLDQLESGTVAKFSKYKNGEKWVEEFRDKTEAIRTCYSSPEFDTSTQKGFIQQLQSLFSEDMSPITLCTVHRAKGLQAENVFIVCDQARKDIMPLVWKDQEPWEFEQEINITYVAVTRAMKVMRFCSSDKETSDRHFRKFHEGEIRNMIKRLPNNIIPFPVLTDSVTETTTEEKEEVTIVATKTKKKKKIKKKVYHYDT